MSQTTSNNSIANMAAVQTAIANQDGAELKQLLDGQTLDPLQKAYLKELADIGSDNQILQIIDNAPEKGDAGT